MDWYYLSNEQVLELLEQLGMKVEYKKVDKPPKRQSMYEDDIDNLIDHINQFMKLYDSKSKQHKCVDKQCSCKSSTSAIVGCCAECSYSIVSDVPIELDGKVEQVCYCKFKKCLVLALGKVCGFERRNV